jgi:hypothetical protein
MRSRMWTSRNQRVATYSLSTITRQNHLNGKFNLHLKSLERSKNSGILPAIASVCPKRFQKHDTLGWGKKIVGKSVIFPHFSFACDWDTLSWEKELNFYANTKQFKSNHRQRKTEKFL